MGVKLLTEHHGSSLALKEAAQARMSLCLSKCLIVGNLMFGSCIYNIKKTFFFSAVGKTSCQYSRLYRLLREDEKPKEEGIIAESPNANVSVHFHVDHGSNHRTQFVSASSCMSSARAFARWRSPTGKRIATINVDELTKLGDVYYVDLTIADNRSEHLNSRRSQGRARKYDEVMILGDIPPSCIEDITVIEQ